jgi:crotonobetainyl-CoA:carnitine CoA-transferase CaiB-like acyl-CoA transferase
LGDNEPLLAHVRVLDLCDGEADIITRLLADLGADVLKIEPPAGSPGRWDAPTLDGVSIPFALHNANKRAAVLDPADEADRRRLVELAADADIVVDSGRAADYGTSGEQLADRFAHLVAMTVTDFGADGPRASWQATDPVLYAMSTALSRSGPTAGTPVLPPEGIASATAAVQAAWAVLVAYVNRLRCGAGDYVDFARFDAVVLALDAPFGTQGQAATARGKGERWRGRPKNQDLYPIFPCRDGYVRICVLSPRQWWGMRAWLGEPAQFADPRFDSIAARVMAFGELGALMAELFADQTMDDLVAQGQQYGVPIAAVLTPSEALESEHFDAAGAMTDAELAPGVRTRIPVGYWTVDGHRAGYRSAAPAAGSAEPRWLRPAYRPTADTAPGGRPLDGVRVLDLGIIVAGGELSRLFGDLGAEVIKLESAAYPDGLRQTREGQVISESFARAHRNHLGLGLELRTPDGAALFQRLVAASDALFANFKPGTLDALGFSYERLRQLNPALVLAESSAFGDTGPWSGRMGYGPLVRAATGVTRLWTCDDEGGDDEGADDGTSDGGGDASARHRFYDATTIFPDHVVGRITAIGALAALVRRRRDGIGARIHVSQAEAVINQLDTRYVMLAAETHHAAVRADHPAHVLLACAGDDEWCVVSLTSEDDRRAAAEVVGAAAGHDVADLPSALAAWAAPRSPAEAAAALQAAGLAAGPMNRADDLLDDPQLLSRHVLAEMTHPGFDVTLPTEAGPAPYRNIPPAPQRPAPLPGADTRAICRDLLAMDTDDIDRLLATGVLFTTESP